MSLRRRVPVVLTLLAGLGVAAWAGPPAPGGDAVRVPQRSVVLVKEGTLPATAEARGRFGPGVRLVAGAGGHMNVLIPNGPAFHDGEAEAVFALSAKPWVTLLIRSHTRTSPDDSLEGLSTVGLTLRPRYVRWDRWDDGVTLPLAPRTPVDLAGKRVRVRVEAHGTQLAARILDADSGTLLATTEAWDTGSGTGRVGVRFERDTTSALVELLARPQDPPDRGLVPGDPSAPLGDERFVLIDAALLDRVPSELGVESLGVWPYDDRGLHGLLLTPSQVAALRARGLAFIEQALVPFWAYDPDVRAAAGQVPTKYGRPDLEASYKDGDMVADVLAAWHRLHPDITRVSSIGTTVEGRDILAIRITDNPDQDEPDEPAVLLSGAMHGSELLATEYTLDAADRLLTGYATPEGRRRVDNLDIWVVPLLNVDGNHRVLTVTRHAGRKNVRPTHKPGGAVPWGGVDLNRNFPFGYGRGVGSSGFPNSAYYRGEQALSEPESQAFAALAHERHFAAAISFHTAASMILVPYTMNGFAQPEPNAAWTIAEEIAAVTPRQPSGKDLRVRKQIYEVDGTDQDWLRYAFGTIAYILEGSHHNPEERAIRLASVRALRPVVPTLLDRVLDGPRLTVFAVDEAGKPVQAVIDVSAEVLGNGEQWTTRALDGRHDRVLATGGPTTVTATAEGYAPASQEVVVDGVTEVRLVLRRE